MFIAPSGYQTIYGPTIPYLGPIYGGLREGVSIYIQGSVHSHSTRFFVNLLCGESESSDIALHFNPRFDSWDKVIFNSCYGGSWGHEHKIHHMPFCRGQAFEMVIMSTSQGYQIKVDGNDFHTFEHRVPMERVCGMHISGDVSIQTINVIGDGHPAGGMGGEYPGGMEGYPGCMGGYPGGMGGVMGGGYPGGIGVEFPEGMGCGMGGMGGQPICNPTLPYSVMIPGGMFHRRTVIIRGMVPFGADGLRINFMVSRSRDIAFHLNHRVREGFMLRNSMIGGSWGQEDRDLSMNPFLEGQYFDMSIRCGFKRFKVFVNGQYLFDYFHRHHAFHEIDILEIEGDVQISYIDF